MFLFFTVLVLTAFDYSVISYIQLLQDSICKVYHSIG